MMQEREGFILGMLSGANDHFIEITPPARHHTGEVTNNHYLTTLSWCQCASQTVPNGK